MALVNNEGMMTQDTQPPTPATQKTANTARASKRKSSKKGSTTESAKATKKSKTSKEGDAEAQTALASKLAVVTFLGTWPYFSFIFPPFSLFS